jgi:hypothetical protein
MLVSPNGITGQPGTVRARQRAIGGAMAGNGLSSPVRLPDRHYDAAPLGQRGAKRPPGIRLARVNSILRQWISRDGQRLPAAALQPILAAGYPACWRDVLSTSGHLENGDCQDECCQATGLWAHLSISQTIYGQSENQTPPWHSGMISTPTASSSLTSSAGSGPYPMGLHAPCGPSI